MGIKETISRLEYLQEKITPLPWRFTANIPFYVDLSKPAPSMSKHDDTRPSYWRYEDGMYAAEALNAIPELLAEIARLQEQLNEL